MVGPPVPHIPPAPEILLETEGLPPGALLRLEAAEVGQDKQGAGAAGQLVRMVRFGYPEAVALDPGGTRLATCFGSRWIQVWDLDARRELRRIPLLTSGLRRPLGPEAGPRYPLEVLRLTFSADGRYLVGLVRDREAFASCVWSWELDSDGEHGIPLRVPSLHPVEIARAGDGDVLILGWETATRALMPGMESQVFAWTLARYPMKADHPIFEEEVHQAPLPPPDGPLPPMHLISPAIPDRQALDPLCATPGGDRVLAVEWGGRLVVRDATTGQELRVLEGFEGTQAMGMHPDGRTLALGGGGAVRLLDLRTGAESGRVDSFEHLAGCQFTAGGNRLVVSGDPAGLEVFRLDRPEDGPAHLGREARLAGRAMGRQPLAMDASGELLAGTVEPGGEHGHRVTVWRTRDLLGTGA